MIKVAVVDDEKQELERMISYLKRLQTELSEELAYVTFCSGEMLLEEYDYSFDLICLDIDMDGLDGIETAKRIRALDDQVLLMFITNMAQMAIRGYEVQALDFVLKPVQYYSLALKMRNISNIINQRKSRNIVLSTPYGIQKISTSDLYYVEVSGHYLQYYTKNESFRQKASLKELEQKVEGLSFKRCNNCYLVNLKYVDGVEKDDLLIRGTRLKISRPRKKEFLRSLANYMGGIDTSC